MRTISEHSEGHIFLIYNGKECVGQIKFKRCDGERGQCLNLIHEGFYTQDLLKVLILRESRKIERHGDFLFLRRLTLTAIKFALWSADMFSKIRKFRGLENKM